MNDPHVEWLKYRLKIHSAIVFENPPPLEHEEQLFRLHLEEDVLTVSLKEHYATVEAAKKDIESFLRSWEIYVSLLLKCLQSYQTIEFECVEEFVIDRNPLPTTSKEFIIYPKGIALTSGLGNPSLTITLNNYPEPPKRFKASPDVETMWFRYQGHIQGKEPLQAMGFFCLTLFELSGGGLRKAPETYRVERDVLKKLGELTSTRGTERDARKVQSNSFIPLTDQEQRWIHEAVKMLIRRKGEYDFDPSTADSLPQITMKDLPNLPASPK